MCYTKLYKGPAEGKTAGFVLEMFHVEQIFFPGGIKSAWQKSLQLQKAEDLYIRVEKFMVDLRIHGIMVTLVWN